MSRPPLDFKAVLLHHLEYTFEKEAWQPSLAMAIEGVTRFEAAWKPGPNRHSIWQIVRHVTRWKQATLRAWDGTHPLRSGGEDTEHYTALERSDWDDPMGDEAAWHADVRALQAVSTEIRDRVEGLTADEILRPFPGEEMPGFLRLLRMATHDIYHAGQIRYLRALHRGNRPASG